MLLLVTLLALAQEPQAPKLDPAVTRADLERTVRFLASDELAGRKTGTPESMRAAQFLADGLARAGVRPGGDDGGYFQKVPMTRTAFRSVPKLTAWDQAGATREFTAGVDFDWFSGAPSAKRLALRKVTKDEEMSASQDGEVALFLDGSMGDRRRWLGATRGVGFGLVVAPGSDKPGAKALETPPRGGLAMGTPAEQPAGTLRAHGELLALLRAGKLAALRVDASVEHVELPAANVIGVLPGVGSAETPELAQQVIVFSAHYDHLGLDERAPSSAGDTIRNGADDDASGCAAVLELAEALAAGPKPARTLVFLFATAEEIGLLGTNWYIDHPLAPLERTVCNLNFEMIGRPDELVGGPGKMWLTGDERSNLGEHFRALGMPVVADPRPQQRFFERSDNYAFARRGIVAQTLSSYNLHTDYHGPDDEFERIDFVHMQVVVGNSMPGVRALADGVFTPTWSAGGDPSKK